MDKLLDCQISFSIKDMVGKCFWCEKERLAREQGKVGLEAGAHREDIDCIIIKKGYIYFYTKGEFCSNIRGIELADKNAEPLMIIIENKEQTLADAVNQIKL